MPPTLSAHSFHISCGSCLLATSAQSPRPAPRPALRPDGRGGRLRCPCLLAPLLSCCRSLRLAASACLAWRRGVVRLMKKKAGGAFVLPVRLLLCLYDVVFALVVVVHEALLIDDVAIRSAQADVRVCVAWLELLAHAEAVRPAFHI